MNCGTITFAIKHGDKMPKAWISDGFVSMVIDPWSNAIGRLTDAVSDAIEFSGDGRGKIPLVGEDDGHPVLRILPYNTLAGPFQLQYVVQLFAAIDLFGGIIAAGMSDRVVYLLTVPLDVCHRRRFQRSGTGDLLCRWR